MLSNSLSSLRYYMRLLLVILLTTNTAFSVNTGEIDWEEWDNSVIRLIVRDDSGMSSGTAFAIDNNGNYITNHHVIVSGINGGKVGAVESLEPEKIHNATIVWHSEEHDLAMVHVDTWKKPGLTLSSGDSLKKGQVVYSIGYPGAADRNNSADFNVPTIKKGIFSAFKTFQLMSPAGRNIKMLEHDASVNSGNSGGPLADTCGRVVGINEQKSLGEVIDDGSGGVAVNSAEGIQFSINTIELMALLKQHNVDFTRDDVACSSNVAGVAADSNKKSVLALAIVGALALMFIIGFILLYRRVKNSNNGKFDTRVLSRMIRDRVNGSDPTSQAPTPDAPARSYYSHDDGRIIHRDEQRKEEKLTPTPEKPLALYCLSPHRNDLGLPTLNLSSPGNYTLGRANNNQLVIINQYVSSIHLQITINPDHSVVVEDLDSMNGTHVNGEKITRGDLHLIHPGQSLRVGHDDIIYSLKRL